MGKLVTQKQGMSKRESFLLQVNYRTRKEVYELRRLARAALDATDNRTFQERDERKLRKLEEFLNKLDGQDQHTWETIVGHCAEETQHIASGGKDE